LLIVIGVFLKRGKVIGDGFQKSSSVICFKLGLPSLIFLKIAGLSFSGVFDTREILILAGLSILTMIIAMAVSLGFEDIRQKGSYVQGTFRGNVAIIGLALILNLYGEELAARGAMVVALLLPLLNIMSVMALTLPQHGFSRSGLLVSLKSIATNPIILAVLAALLFSLFRIPVPAIPARLLKYLADLTLPLALINIGGSLTVHGLREKGKRALSSSLLKTVILPAIAILIFYNLGYEKEELGMIFLLMGSPAAISSHIMAESMDNDGDLAALIVMVSTALAALTTVVGISLINAFL